MRLEQQRGQEPRCRTVSSSAPENLEDLVQEVGNTLQWATLVQQVGYSTKQIAQQVTRTGLRSDVEHHLVQIDDQPKQVEVKRAKHQVKNVAYSGRRYGQSSSATLDR